MGSPLPVKIALGGSVILGTAGLCDSLGLFASAGAVGVSLALIPLSFAALAALLIVCGGEMAKARLLEWARDAEGFRRALGRCLWALFVGLSICLTHGGLMFAERMALSPVIAPLEAVVTNARSALESAERSERAEADRIDARVAEIGAEIGRAPDTWSGARERVRLRAERDAIRDTQAEALTTLERATARAGAALARAEASMESAPKGFLSLALPLPFGLGLFPVIAWLLPVAIECLTGLVGWIAAPRICPRRGAAWSDILDLDVAGLELIAASDPKTFAALRSKLASAHAKATHVAKGAAKKSAVC